MGPSSLHQSSCIARSYRGRLDGLANVLVIILHHYQVLKKESDNLFLKIRE